MRSLVTTHEITSPALALNLTAIRSNLYLGSNQFSQTLVTHFTKWVRSHTLKNVDMGSLSSIGWKKDYFWKMSFLHFSNVWILVFWHTNLETRFQLPTFPQIDGHSIYNGIVQWKYKKYHLRVNIGWYTCHVPNESSWWTVHVYGNITTCYLSDFRPISLNRAHIYVYLKKRWTFQKCWPRTYIRMFFALFDASGRQTKAWFGAALWARVSCSCARHTTNRPLAGKCALWRVGGRERTCICVYIYIYIYIHVHLSF